MHSLREAAIRQRVLMALYRLDGRETPLSPRWGVFSGLKVDAPPAVVRILTILATLQS